MKMFLLYVHVLALAVAIGSMASMEMMLFNKMRGIPILNF